MARIAIALCVSVIAARSAQISISSSTTAPGTSLPLSITFASQCSSVTGIQFDLQFDPSALRLSATVGESARSSGKILYSWDLSPGLRRFLVVGLNQDAIVDGALINLFANVSNAVSGGAYPLKFLNATATGASVDDVAINAVDGGIVVQGTDGSRLQPEGVLNGASLLPGRLAPGEIVTLVGSGIGPGSTIFFDGTSAPLLYASPDQINAVVSYEIHGKASTRMEVTQGNQTIADLLISIADTAPAVFTLDGSGVGQAAILNQNGTVNSPYLPAEKGSAIMIFATGAGQTDPPGMDGQITEGVLSKPLLPVTVQIGGRDATVLYAGAAPGLVAGVLQVNCTVPLDSPSGYAVPIVLFVGKTSSQIGVTLAVR